jgi:hypothetical protein
MNTWLIADAGSEKRSWQGTSMKYVDMQHMHFRALTFSSDGRFLASLHASMIVRFWSLPAFAHHLAVRLRDLDSPSRTTA